MFFQMIKGPKPREGNRDQWGCRDSFSARKGKNRQASHQALHTALFASTLDVEDRTLYTRSLWRMKEAMVKCSGDGIRSMTHALRTPIVTSIPLSRQFEFVDASGIKLTSITNDRFSFALASVIKTKRSYAFSIR